MKVIKASKLVDANGVVKDPILVINEGIIEEVGPDVSIPDDAEVIDAGELTLIPGLIDCHIHLYGHEKMGKKHRPQSNGRTVLLWYHLGNRKYPNQSSAHQTC